LGSRICRRIFGRRSRGFFVDFFDFFDFRSFFWDFRGFFLVFRSFFFDFVARPIAILAIVFPVMMLIVAFFPNGLTSVMFVAMFRFFVLVTVFFTMVLLFMLVFFFGLFVVMAGFLVTFMFVMGRMLTAD